MSAFIEQKSFALIETKAQGEGRFSGYASTWGIDLENDRIAPGAFAKSIAEKSGKVPLLWQHDPAQWIGFSTSLAEDEKGLSIEALIALGVTKGAETYSLLKVADAGDFRVGLSIGFIATDWQWDEARQGRDLKEIELWEVSCVAFPANPEALVESVKGLGKLERLLMGVTGCSMEAASAFRASLRRPF